MSNKPTQNPVVEPGYLRLSNKPTQNKPTQIPVGTGVENPMGGLR